MSELNLRPLSNRVVVEPDDPAEQTRGGIHIPSTASKDREVQTGVVRVVGPGKVSEFPVVKSSSKDGPEREEASFGAEFKRLPMSVEEGQRVIFGKYSGAKVEIERESFRVIKEREILCIIEGEEENDS